MLYGVHAMEEKGSREKMKSWQDHKWVANPTTRTERRWALNIYCQRTNVIAIDHKYLNIDTGKFDSDKLPTLYHSSLAEMAVPESHDYGCQDSRHTRADRYYSRNERWFTPKDDDFDEELEREERERAAKVAAEEKAEKARKEEYRLYCEKQAAEQAVEREKARLKSILNEHVYAQVLAEAEERVRQQQAEEYRIKEQQELRRRIAHQAQCNIRPNRWVPK